MLMSRLEFCNLTDIWQDEVCYWAFLTGKALKPVDNSFENLLISPLLKNIVRARFRWALDDHEQQPDSIIGVTVLNRF